MPLMPVECGVEQCYVEHARLWRAVGRRDVLGRRRFLVAATVNDDPEIVETHALAFRALKLVAPFRRGQMAGDPALGVVIAESYDGPDAGAREACKLGNGELAGRLVLPGSVIKIARDHDEGGTFPDREINDVRKRLAGRAAHQARECLITSRQSVQWAV